MSTEKLEQPVRLNPLAFPLGTDTHFRLFLLSALALAITIGTILPILLDPDGPGIQMDLIPTPSNQGTAQFFVGVQETALHNLLLVLRYIAPPAVIISIMALIALVRYRAHPQRLIRRLALKPLIRVDDTYFVEEVERLSSQVGIWPPPMILSRKQSLKESASGQAFGLPGRLMLRLDGNLRLRLRKRPAETHAVVFHELAHIANHDIGRSYGADAIWLAAAWLTIGPLLLIFHFHFITSWAEQFASTGQLNIGRLLETTFSLLVLLARSGGVLLVVALARASLLRAREIYADWRAAHWGATEGLEAVLIQEDTRERKSSNRWRQWSAWLRLHPTPAKRLQLLREPLQVFRIELGLMLMIGMLLGILLLGLVVLLPSIIIGSASILILLAANLVWLDVQLALLLITWSYPLAGLLFVVVVVSGAHMIGATLAIQIQQHAMAALILGRNNGASQSLWSMAVALSIGIELGLLVVPISQMTPHSIQEIIGIMLWVVCVFLITWGAFVYTRSLAQRALGSYTGTARPVWRQRLIGYALSVFLSIWAVPLAFIRVQLTSLSLADIQTLLPMWVMGVIGAFLLSLVVISLCEAILFFGRCKDVSPCVCESIDQRSSARYCIVCSRSQWPWLVTGNT